MPWCLFDMATHEHHKTPQDDFAQYPSTGNLSSCFFLFWEEGGGRGGLISICSYLAPVELFFKQLKGLQFSTRAELLFFYDLQFSRCVVCHVYTFIKNGTFNHCGRSNAWNSTHHGRYVFQTAFFFVRNMTTDMCTYTYTYTIFYTYIYKNTCAKNKCDYAVECVGCVVGWCGVVWCSAVCCCRGVLVLGILKLEIGKIQGFLSVNL